MNFFKLYIKLILTLPWILLGVQLGFADNDKSELAEVLPAEQIVLQRFDPMFNQVSLELTKNKQHYLSDPVAYDDFVNRLLKPLWDTQSTSSALIGRQRFEKLSEADKAALVDAVDNTLRRYAFEGLERYSGQLFRVVDVVVNERASMGWVQILMESSLIPDLHIDVLIKQVAEDSWKAVDIRFKGITYVAVKKHKFRETIEEKGIGALISDLQAKNRKYFVDICTKANIVSRAPCPSLVN